MDLTGRPDHSRALWLGTAVGAMALSALPIVLVSFPLATDLPQHVAQIRLLEMLAANPEAGAALTVNWLSPNSGVYALLWLCWRLVGPELCGHLALSLLVMSWVGASFAMARQRERSIPAAILASLFVFNLSLYWGFLNFMVGFPVFAAWWLLASKPLTGKRAAALVASSALLYWAHALWFAYACLTLPVLVLLERRALLPSLAKLTTQLPIGILSLVWAPALGAQRAAWGYDVQAHWFTPVWSRLDPRAWLSQGLEGGGNLPLAAMVCICAWLAAAAWRVWKEEPGLLDRALFATALIGLAIFVIAPDDYLNTISFNSRWLPCALAWLVLSLPPPRLDARITHGAAMAVFLIFVGHTAATWRLVERHELSGLEAALERLPSGSRLLGLDFVKHSEFVAGRPFLQTSAWADAWRGASTQFTFAEHASSVVRYRSPRRIPWTPGLDWYPERLQPGDFGHFEFVLVNLPEPMHERFENDAPVEPLTRRGRWRLYRVLQTPSLARRPDA